MSRLWFPLWCLVFPASCTQSRDWAFVQAVGGIAIEQPKRQNQRLILPVHADVSGLTRVTVKPSLVNSGLVCETVLLTRTGQEIDLTILTGLVRQGLSPQCPAADLGYLPPGAYRVFYLSPNGEKQALGRFTL